MHKEAVELLNAIAEFDSELAAPGGTSTDKVIEAAKRVRACSLAMVRRIAGRDIEIAERLDAFDSDAQAKASGKKGKNT